jgi:two-component system sensor histidine kinase YesM
MRFDNKFDVIYEFTNEALSCRMPKMLLQPIVENAVFHGLEAKMDKGLLKIQAYVNAVNDLVVIVEDDGMGIDEDILNEINSNLKNKKTDVLENTSIGIFNVNNRIKLTYGDAYGISVESVAGKGTKVVLKIPVGEALD